jgi:hypothetical protein
VRLTRRITRLENKVHQAMAVMDKDTGKLLNYRQLMNSPKYKKAWSLSAANEFGWLANGIGGRIKNPTNTIEFISQNKVPAFYIRIILEEPGHVQPPTPLQTDYAMAAGIINGKVQPKQTKATEMRFHWLCNWECQ